MKQTFAGKVREVVRAVQARDGQVTLAALKVACEGLIRTREERDHKLGNTVRDFCRADEMRRKSRGVYEYLGRQGLGQQKQAIMWRYLRSGRTFGGVSVPDLMEVSGATLNYVLDWLHILGRQGIVKHVGDKWQLTSDPVERPAMDEKADRLRAIRAKKRAKVLEALAKAKTAIEAAEQFISRGDAEEAKK
jgi:hypothetical protein